jgi:hypothetical protein
VAVAGRPEHASRVAGMRSVFEQRTGRFGPEDPWFEARSRAFWDDALTRQGFAEAVEGELPGDARAWVPALARTHRGLFVVATGEGHGRVFRDVWGGAEFVVHEVDEASRDAVGAAHAPFDGRLAALANPARVALLPGAVFHPEDAFEPLSRVLDAARARELPADDVLDALLRMELSLRALSRVKPAYAYRAEALG